MHIKLYFRCRRICIFCNIFGGPQGRRCSWNLQLFTFYLVKFCAPPPKVHLKSSCDCNIHPQSSLVASVFQQQICITCLTLYRYCIQLQQYSLQCYRRSKCWWAIVFPPPSLCSMSITFNPITHGIRDQPRRMGGGLFWPICSTHYRVIADQSAGAPPPCA